MSTWFDSLNDDIATTLLRVRVELPEGGTVDKDIRPDVVIDYDMLEEQLEETPSAYVFWSMVLAESKKNVATLERIVKRRKGDVTRELLGDAREKGVSLRRADVDDLIEADEKLNELEGRLILANRTLSKLFAVVEAMRMKSDHLRSLAGFKRQEQRDSK